MYTMWCTGRLRELLPGRRRAAERVRAGGDPVHARARAARHHVPLRAHGRQGGHRRARRATILQVHRLWAHVPVGWPCPMERAIPGAAVCGAYLVQVHRESSTLYLRIFGKSLYSYKVLVLAYCTALHYCADYRTGYVRVYPRTHIVEGVYTTVVFSTLYTLSRLQTQNINLFALNYDACYRYKYSGVI